MKIVVLGHTLLFYSINSWFIYTYHQQFHLSYIHVQSYIAPTCFGVTSSPGSFTREI